MTCARVEQVEGVRFQEMVARLAQPEGGLDALLQQIIDEVLAAARAATLPPE